MDISLPAESPAASDAAAASGPQPLWNPRAATWWGLLLSPAFSAYIHMRNWQALGQEDKAGEARTWFYMFMIYLVVSCFLAGASEILGRDLTPPSSAALGMLAAWHIFCGRGQERYIAALTGGAYSRRPWTRTVFSALGIFTAIVLFNAALIVFITP